MVRLFLFVVGLALYTRACQDRATTARDWWQSAQFYQIYPRSFKDSDGDGIGDLNGITSKLEYLKDIGVTAAWLSPIFKSPMVDFGYDISDFYAIQPEYGTIEDFRALIKRANQLGIKIILDFVPNHSSDENEWFKKSVRREQGYEDFYVWHNGKINATTGQRQPPSNWLQGFRGSAWEWNEQRQQYYLHQFAIQQPDLNYRNPAVVKEMENVLRYWLNEGVAGFRCDAVPVIYEVAPDANGQYPDEEVSGLTDDKDDRDYLKSELISNRPESIYIVYEWRQVLDEYKSQNGGSTRVLLIETYAPPDYTMQFYGNSTTEGAQLPFNFNLLTVPKQEGVSALTMKKAIDNWLLYMPEGGTPNWVIGNHDQRRAASRYGVANTDAMNMLVMLLPGASVTYQGEELGMTDGEISWADTQDPAACRSNADIYEQFTRDPSRTPFHWSADVNAGFSSSTKTWLPLAADYATINVEVENRSSRSHLKIYKTLVELRKTLRVLQSGSTKYATLTDDVLIIKRYLSGQPSIIFVANFGEYPNTVDLSAFDATLPERARLILRSLDSTKNVGTQIAIGSLTLYAGEALVFIVT